MPGSPATRLCLALNNPFYSQPAGTGLGSSPRLALIGREFVKDQLESLIALLVDRGVPFAVAHEEFEKKYIHHVLEQTQWNQSRAARLLSMHRNTLSRKIEDYRLVRNGRH